MSSTVRQALIVFSLLGFLHGTISREAPGDHDDSCRENLNAPLHDFPDDWEILVDSYDYGDLFGTTGDTPWSVRDFDGDNFKWDNLFGGVCTRSLYSCSFRGRGEQNNWVFSQFINYQEANEIFFDLDYRFSQCRDTSTCSNDFVTLHSYNTNNPGDRENTENYRPLFGDEQSSRLQQPPAPTRGVRETLSLLRPEPRTRGFYLGFQDQGTCGQVERIVVYYTACRARQNELVRYPKVGTPPRGGPDMTFLARCVDNAHNVTSLEVKAFSGNGTCRDVVAGGVRCECDDGYEMSPDRSSCIACDPGTFRALTVSRTCQTCPANSMLDAEATSKCECRPGFFRRDVPGEEEGPEKGCTEPPSRVTDLQVAGTSDSSITVTWSKPAITGRDDFFYEILISAIRGGTGVVVESSYRDIRSAVDYTISDLRPFTSYNIMVITHNGVSAQDPENADRRTQEVTGETAEGVPGVPSLNRLCTVIIWSPPEEPAGIIIGYEVRFPEISDEVLSFGPSENFYITTDVQKNGNARVQIRALNTLAASPWTEPLPLDCTNNVGCSIINSKSLPPASTPVPTMPPTCGPLDDPEFGSVTVVAGEAQYSCDEGRVLVGDATRACLGDSTWSGREPTCVLACKLLPVQFELKGQLFANNSQVLVQDIGSGDDALMAVTSFEECCRTQRVGEFYYPDGSQVGRNADSQPFYRNRETQLIRLHRRNSDIDEATRSLLGQFRSEILDGCGEITNMYINIVSS